LKKGPYLRINMSSTIVEIPSVGQVTIVKSQRAKLLRVTVKPDQTVRLTMPRGESVDRAIQFLHSKIPWITKHQHRFSKLENTPTNLPQPKINGPQAIETLISRLEELAKIHNFTYTKSSIRNQKTKWGSCSAKNNISLNVNLARLPAELTDYVILHELVHTRIKNHSSKFWTELDAYVGGGARALSQVLRSYTLPM
jgi:predicted metal-dependent hydrolase